MLLVAEQLKQLRKNRKELLARKEKYREMIMNRDRSNMEGIGLPAFEGRETVEEYYRISDELREVQDALSTSTIKRERNFDFVDIGTIFKGTFDDGTEDSAMLVEKNIGKSSIDQTSIESALGKAVYGKKEGDVVTYTVKGAGELSFRIDQIDRMKDHYDSFITERDKKHRTARPVKREIKNLAVENPEEYKKRHQYTMSQLFIINEEINKIGRNASPSEKARKAYLERYLKVNTLAEPPKDNTIGIGSIVSILIRNEDGTLDERNFELINEAVSTEVDSEYVERISTLGQALYGKKAGDSFKLRRSNQSSLNGIVATVDNTNTLGNEKHR